jgi:hypothetical protein
VDPAPPQAPWSIRVFGWVIIALSMLSLLFFTLGMLASLGSTSGVPPAAGAIGYLLSIATGIGFVTGWRWSWLTGLVLAVAGVAFGVWVVSQIGATLQTRAGFAVLWIGPPLLLLLCLLLPASLRWAIGAPPAGATVSAIRPPEVVPPRRRLLVPTVTIVVAAIVVAAWFFHGRGPGSFPREIGAFHLVESRTADGYNPVGPPVSDRSNLRLVRFRDAIYVDARRSYTVRIIEDELTSQFPHDVLLLASGTGIVTSPAFPEGRLGRVTARTVDGVRYTCVRTKVVTACLWTEPFLTAWISGDGGVRLDHLRALSKAVHDAMT